MKLVKRKSGTRVSDHHRYQIWIMFSHMNPGTIEKNCRWIARKIGGISWATVRRIVREEHEKELTAKAGPVSDSDAGFQGAQWSEQDRMTPYPTIDAMHADWHDRRGITGTPEQERVAREQAARGKAA